MTVTTTVAAVNKIIVYDTTVIPDVQPFIDSAIVIVSSIVAIDNTPTDAMLELVTRYVTAHLISITDTRIASEQVKSLQQSFQYKLSDGLGLSHFGATAMLLDTTGRLAAWNNRVVNGLLKPQFFWAGSDE